MPAIAAAPAYLLYVGGALVGTFVVAKGMELAAKLREYEECYGESVVAIRVTPVSNVPATTKTKDTTQHKKVDPQKFCLCCRRPVKALEVRGSKCPVCAVGNRRCTNPSCLKKCNCDHRGSKCKSCQNYL